MRVTTRDPKGTLRGCKAVLFAMMLTLVVPTLGREYDLSRWTIDGGGKMFAIGGDFELSGTIGQPDAGTMSGGDFTLSGGFWFEWPPGDCNSTGGVNLLDYDELIGCLTGPGGEGVAPDCVCYDLDRDGDVDLDDFSDFQTAFTGGE